MSTDKTERAAFEATIGAGRVLARTDNGEYVSTYVQNDWDVWQAAVKEIQRAACNFCLAEAAKALPSQPATVVQPVAFANPVILLPDAAGEEEWTAKVQSHRDDVFSLPLFAHPSAPAESGWQPIASAPKDGSEIWAYNGEQAVMRWSEGSIQGGSWALWVWADQTLADIDPDPAQPTYWRNMPAAPSAAQPGGADGGEG